MPDHRVFSVFIDIPADKFLHYYAGTVRQIVAKTDEGTVIQFPASILQKFVTHYGVRGYFSIRLGSDNQLISIEKKVD